MSIAQRLYRGEVSYDYLAKRRTWYAISGLILVVSIASLIVRGFNFGIEFKGGSTFQFPAGTHSVQDARDAVESVGVMEPVVQLLKSVDGNQEIKVTTRELVQTPASGEKSSEQAKVEDALAKEFGVSVDDLNPSSVGSSWGSSVTNRALWGLITFLILVIAYISVRFEPKMAAAAIIALLHDLLITAGIYSLVGFEVTPSTVIALLTILGFSLYDTVVVFDKVRENTAGLGATSRMSYTSAANLAINQTIMRSINTSLIALLPVGALLFVGAGLLGAGTLKDLALAQFVGLAAGAYSSIFIATPILAELKEREPGMQALAARVARAQASRSAAPATSTATALAAEASSVAVLDAPPASTGRPRTPPARSQQARSQQGRKKKPHGRPSGKKRR